MKDILVGERYQIDVKIGEGGFGLVYAGTDMKLGDEVAIKLMHVNNDPEIIKAEADTYKVLAGGVGIPRGDDLESLGYVLLYFARGSLPWQGFKAATEEEKNEWIKKKKLKMSVTELCQGLLEQFVAYITYTRSLGFKDRPNYAYLRRLFRNAFSARGFKYDNIFDWTEKLFFEMQGGSAENCAGIEQVEH
ncbi:hypothetical protein ED733_000368 [Metarhizium rileyi]|uniref:Protein kinase domain-containing protein n=1 Tax=Metarhizium rileyi (strain RCEF 4871) TaxID=1649241 RepID=A0A5C6G3T8_METRR|nr:hypothetical protein ED733_000368 [Metarhizium rileyi]